MDLECSMTGQGGITLVSVVVTNTYDEAARFRLVNRLDGPVWPPRKGGHPEAGWDSEGYRGVLEPGETAVLGYATPADQSTPPAELARVEPAGEADAQPDAAHAIRNFSDGRPPRSVLSPTPSIAGGNRAAGSSPVGCPGEQR